MATKAALVGEEMVDEAEQILLCLIFKEPLVNLLKEVAYQSKNAIKSNLFQISIVECVSWCCLTFVPRGRPTVTAGSDHYFHTCCLSVRPSVKISQRKTNFKRE